MILIYCTCSTKTFLYQNKKRYISEVSLSFWGSTHHTQSKPVHVKNVLSWVQFVLGSDYSMHYKMSHDENVNSWTQAVTENTDNLFFSSCSWVFHFICHLFFVMLAQVQVAHSTWHGAEGHMCASYLCTLSEAFRLLPCDGGKVGGISGRP